MDAGRASLASILPKVPKKKVPRVEPHFETLPGPAFDSINHSYDYSDMDSKSADPKLAQRISELGSAIRDVEKRLSLIDETVDKTYQWNRKDKEEGSGKASCCGYDQRIRGEWLQPGLASMSDVQFSSEQGNDAGVAPANEENGEVQEDAKPGPWLPTQCKVPGKCSKHHGWQRVRVLEAELERDSLVRIFCSQDGITLTE